MTSLSPEIVELEESGGRFSNLICFPLEPSLLVVCMWAILPLPLPLPLPLTIPLTLPPLLLVAVDKMLGEVYVCVFVGCDAFWEILLIFG